MARGGIGVNHGMSVKERQYNDRVVPYDAPNQIKLDEFRAFGEAVGRGRNDPVFFAEHFLGMPTHEGQQKYLRNANAKTNIIVPANRWGKTAAVAIRHLHRIFYKLTGYGPSATSLGAGNPRAFERASYTTVSLAPHSDLTRPVFDTILSIMRSEFVINEVIDGKKVSRTNNCLIGWLLDGEHVRNTSPLYIPFNNNSDILFRSTGEDQGKSIEGRSYGYVSYDEGGQSHHLAFERERRILPRLGEFDGPLDIVSTPEVSSPSILEHYELFLKGGGTSADGKRYEAQEGFYSQEGSIEENRFFMASNPAYMKDMHRDLGADNPLLGQILYGKFVFAGDTFYSGEDIAIAADESLNIGEAYQEGHRYAFGVDTAAGKDEMVFTVMDVTSTPYRVVRQMACKGNSKSPEIHMADFAALVRQYLRLNNLRIILETFNGESANFYRMMPYDLQVLTFCWGTWQPDGIPGSERTRRGRIRKPEILLALRSLLAKREIKVPNEQTLIKQLSIYREDDTNIPTDRVISLALASWLATDGAPKNNNEIIEVDL